MHKTTASDVASLLVIIAAPLTDVWMWEGRIPIAIYISYGIAFAVVTAGYLKGTPRVRTNTGYTVLLYTLAGLIFVAGFLGDKSPRSLQYTAWFLWVVGLYGVASKLLFDSLEKPSRLIIYSEIAVVMTCVLGLYDWLAQNGEIQVSFLDAIGRGQDGYRSSMLGFIRMRSTIEEAGHLGLYLNAFVPITLVRPRKSAFMKVIYLMLVVVAWVLTMSIAAWSFLVASVLIVLSAYFRGLEKSEKLYASVITLIFILGAISFISSDNQLSSRLSDLDDVSRVDRLNIYNEALQRLSAGDLKVWLAGYGPATFITDTGTNPISWYLLFAHDIGLPSLACLVLIVCYIWRAIARSRSTVKTKCLLSISLLSSNLHYAITANFWHPWIWIVFALILSECRNVSVAKGVFNAMNVNVPNLVRKHSRIERIVKKA